MFGIPLRALLLSVGILRPLWGQAAGRTELTLADAVALASSHHPALAAASARRQGATAAAMQESSFPNPILEWRRENLGSPLSRDVFYTVAQPIDLTGRRFALRSGARDVDRRGIFDSTSVARSVEADAARGFIRAALARALLTLAEEQRLDAERLAAFESDRAREGAVAEVAAMRAIVEYDRTRVAETAARAEAMRAVADLARAVGVRPDSLPVISPLSSTISHIDAPPTSDDALRLAFDRRSELAALRAAEEAAQHRVAAERRGALPDVVLQAGAKQTAGYSTRVVGVSLPLPLFNRNTAARDRAAAELDLIRAERRASEQLVRAQVAAALESYRALLAARPAGVESLATRATEVARIADAAYAAGGSSLLELLYARRARAETHDAVLRWVADVQLAHLDLLRAIGASPLDSLE